jgi:hypothetical protein
MSQVSGKQSVPPDPPKSEPFTKFPLWLHATPKLSPAAKTVLVILDDHRNRASGQCNPRVDTLSRETALSRRSVRRGLAELIARRIIQSIRGQRGNTYKLASRSEWQEILRGQIGPMGTGSEGPKWPLPWGQTGPSGAPVSLLTEPELLNQRKEPPIVPHRKRTAKPARSSAKKRLTESDSSLSLQPDLIREPKPIIALAISERQRDTVESWFDEKFWPHYPRKVAKAAALEIAQRVGTSVAIRDAILCGLFRQLPKLSSKDPQYIPHAATWLGQERWLDEPEAPPRPKESQRERNWRIAAEAFVREPSR